MNRTMVAFAFVCAAIASNVRAHELDETVLATQLSVSAGRYEIEIIVRPGVLTAMDLLRRLDDDRDGQVAEAELNRYAQGVNAGISLRVDGQAVPSRLTGAKCATTEELDRGVGVVRIFADAPAPSIPGHHVIEYVNGYDDSVSFLTNTMAPMDTDVSITSQTRDQNQRNLRVEYEVADAPTIPWTAIGVTCLLCLIGLRFREAQLR